MMGRPEGGELCAHWPGTVGWRASMTGGKGRFRYPTSLGILRLLVSRVS